MYDTTPFVEADERAPGFHDVSCEVTWTPRNDPSDARSVFGDFLDADAPGGAVSLGCGIEMGLHALGIDFVDYDHLLVICNRVNRQLAVQPWAELTCPEGTARIVLVPRDCPQLR
jgi:hypothetical protein